MGTIAEKLSYLDETREQILTNIQALGGDLTEESTFRSYADALDEVWEEQDHVTETGTKLSLSTKKGKMKIELSPSELEQATTSISEGDEYDSPSPEHPQEIHTVSGENTIKIKNIQVTHLNGYISLSSSKGIFKTDTDDSMVFPVIQGHKYFIHNSGNRNRGAIFENIPTNNTYCIDGTYNASIPTDTEFEASASGYLVIYINTPNSQNVVDDFIAYEVGKNQSLPLSLGDLEYCKIGDYEDEFYKATESDTGLTVGKWYLKKNIRKLVLNGTESGWSYNSSYKYYMLNNATLVDGVINTPVVSNYWKQAPYLSRIGNSANLLWLFDENDYFEGNIDTFKTWLGNHNTDAYYVLKTPTYTLLSDTLQTQLEAIWRANSYEEQTNISQENNNLPFVINAKALGIETESSTLSLNSLNTMSLNPRLDTEIVEPTVEEQEESVEEEEQEKE